MIYKIRYNLLKNKRKMRTQGNLYKQNEIIISKDGKTERLKYSEKKLGKGRKFKVIYTPEQLDQRIALNISSEEKEKYREMENRVIPEEYKTMVYGVFANNDELFSYKSLFEEIYDKEKIFTIEDGHRISIENIREVVVPLIEQIINTHNIQSF